MRHLARMLRHTPHDYALDVDAHGWANLQSVVTAVRLWRRAWFALTCRDLEVWIETHHADRFQVEQGRIRALYGHSLGDVFTGTAALPPNRLFHGTDHNLLSGVLEEGLRPMHRTRVQLTEDPAYARVVAARFHRGCVLAIEARAAHDRGHTFYRTPCHVWQAAHVAAEFVSIHSFVDPAGEASDDEIAL